MLSRKDIIDYSVRMGCKKDLLSKGMVMNGAGDVFCIATLVGVYPDGEYYKKGIKSPKEAHYCGVYGKGADGRLDYSNPETRKNVFVTRTDGIKKFVYFFEKTSKYSKEYFFHGRYKYMDHKMIKGIDSEHDEDISFHLSFVDRPIIK